LNAEIVKTVPTGSPVMCYVRWPRKHACKNFISRDIRRCSVYNDNSNLASETF